MRFLWSWVVVPWLALGCGAAELPRAEAVADQKPIRASPGRIELHRPSNHPAIHLVERSGDPAGAVAVAFVHDGGSRLSLALLRLLELRLEHAGFGQLVSHAHSLGFELAYLTESAPRAEEFVRAATTAFQTPSNEAERARALRQQLEQPRVAANAGARAVAECSGELGLSGTAPSSAALEAARRSAAAVSNVAFGAVGEEELLDAVAGAVTSSSGWLDAAPVEDPWPANDVASFSQAVGSPVTVSLALRVPSAAVAISAAQVLAEPENALSLKLRALPLAWQLTQVQASARPRGACLRVDLQAADPARAAADDALLVARLTGLELRRLAREQPTTWTLADSLLAPTDPRRAAAAAAWRALSDQLPPGPPRLLVDLNVPSPSTERTTQLALLRSVTEPARTPALPVVRRLETGQREFWALLASPCGTRTETQRLAGTSALLLDALARKASVDQVTVEPWVTVDGVGLLAHAPRRNPYERPSEQAARVARALGTALAGTALSGEDLAAARREHLARFNGTDAGWWMALEVAAPAQAAALDPFGTWDAVSQASLATLAAQRWSLLRGPLRLALSANWDSEQNDVAVETLESWLGPFRKPTALCSTFERGSTESSAANGVDIRVQGDTGDSRAYVVVRLQKRSETAEALTLLLNRAGGWLDQVLQVPELSASARAHLLGGASKAALVIEVHAWPDKSSAAVEQVRALLVRLADGALDVPTTRALTERSTGTRDERRLDPRQRLADLWANTARVGPSLAGSAEELAQLRQSLRQHSVVRVEPSGLVTPKSPTKGQSKTPATTRASDGKPSGPSPKKKTPGTR